MKHWWETLGAAMCGAFAYLYGPFDTLLRVLVVFFAVDYASGLCCAAVEGRLSSREGFKGFVKKLLMFALVGVAALLDRLMPAANGAIRAAVAMFYVANEGLSILENVAQMGVPLPKVLKDALLQLKDKTQ